MRVIILAPPFPPSLNEALDMMRLAMQLEWVAMYLRGDTYNMSDLWGFRVTSHMYMHEVPTGNCRDESNWLELNLHRYLGLCFRQKIHYVCGPAESDGVNNNYIILLYNCNVRDLIIILTNISCATITCMPFVSNMHVGVQCHVLIKTQFTSWKLLFASIDNQWLRLS